MLMTVTVIRKFEIIELVYELHVLLNYVDIKLSIRIVCITTFESRHGNVVGLNSSV